MPSNGKSEPTTAPKKAKEKRNQLPPLTLDDVITAYNVIIEDSSEVGKLPDKTLDAIDILQQGFSAPEFHPVNITFRTTNRRDGDVRNAAFFVRISGDIVARLVAELRLARDKKARSTRRLHRL